VAGDGTTTATVLAQALVREGLRNVAAGASPIAIKRGIEQAAAAVTGRSHILMSALISMSWRPDCTRSKNRTRTTRRPALVGSSKTSSEIRAFRRHGCGNGTPGYGMGP
jgi:hypothetical protein